MAKLKIIWDFVVVVFSKIRALVEKNTSQHSNNQSVNGNENVTNNITINIQNLNIHPEEYKNDPNLNGLISKIKTISENIPNNPHK